MGLVLGKKQTPPHDEDRNFSAHDAPITKIKVCHDEIPVMVESYSDESTYRNRLKDICSSKTKCPRYIPIPDYKLGIITKIYDADTITLSCEIANRDCIMPVRLLGIDTPEIRSKNTLESKSSKEIRDLIIDLCMDSFAHVSECSTDKYGRLLAKLTVEQNADKELQFSNKLTDISEFLLENKLAYKYDGGKKAVFIDEDLTRMSETCAVLRDKLSV